MKDLTDYEATKVLMTLRSCYRPIQGEYVALTKGIDALSQRSISNGFNLGEESEVGKKEETTDKL